MFPYFRILYYKLNATRRISENSRPASEIKLASLVASDRGGVKGMIIVFSWGKYLCFLIFIYYIISWKLRTVLLRICGQITRQGLQGLLASNQRKKWVMRRGGDSGRLLRNRLENICTDSLKRRRNYSISLVVYRGYFFAWNFQNLIVAAKLQ